MTELELVPAKLRGKPPRHFADLDATGRAQAVASLGLPAFRARQLAQHYFGHLQADPEQMTDLPSALRAPVKEALFPALLTQVTRQVADSGKTAKTLWRLSDSTLLESVLMAYADRVTLCVSSQAGCGMACPFCATGKGGLQRNLSGAEILEQVRLAALAARDGAFGQERRLANVVFMGMGEPLANYRAVMHAVRHMIAGPPEGFGLSARGITISTCGLVPGIDKLAAEGLPLTLAVSLHAPDDAARDELVPVNRRWPVAEVLDAARRYFVATSRRVSIEYALIRDVNDQRWRAELLARELRRRGKGWVHVNPIPLNPVPGSRWTASREDAENAFVSALLQAGIPTTIRDTRGRQIDGACGQLAASGGAPPGAAPDASGTGPRLREVMVREGGPDG